MGKLSNTDILKKQMVEALEKSLGIVTSACKNVGIARETHYKWLRVDIKYKEEVESIEGIALDFAESQLHQQIKRGEVSSTIFYLKTKGKHRGYIEKTEHDIKIHQEQPLYPPLTEDGVVLKSLLNDN
tara:strand:- start:666 stop:1049 length:384 start_codon:yes stop_codon:yes gene_type:complete